MKSVILATMQMWAGVEGIQKKFQGGVVTIGNFDGLHLGHQSLLKRALEEKGPHIVITFDPHPLQFLEPERALKRLFPKEDLGEQLYKFGIDLLVVLPFDKQLAETSAEDFWRTYIWEPFQPKHVVAGHDFGFGQGRSGTLENLKAWTRDAGSELHVLPPLEVAGLPASSRRLREMVEAGDVESAVLLLGRHFYLRGPIVGGAARGRQLGFPTLNMQPTNEIMPALGVYATLASLDGDKFVPSVTNVGVNPTFGGHLVKVETHVLDRTLEGQAEYIQIQLLKRIRPEMKFASIEDLKKQILSDILNARDVTREALDLVKSNQ